jgi:hypothetical protein
VSKRHEIILSLTLLPLCRHLSTPLLLQALGFLRRR